MHQFPKFTPAWNSTCFGQFLCPSSGVYSLYSRQWYTAYRSEDSFRAGPWLCSKAVYKPVWCIPLPSVQWINSWWWVEELPETCRVSSRSKFGKLVHLYGFIIKKFVVMQHGQMNVKFDVCLVLNYLNKQIKKLDKQKAGRKHWILLTHTPRCDDVLLSCPFLTFQRNVVPSSSWVKQSKRTPSPLNMNVIQPFAMSEATNPDNTASHPPIPESYQKATWQSRISQHKPSLPTFADFRWHSLTISRCVQPYRPRNFVTHSLISIGSFFKYQSDTTRRQPRPQPGKLRTSSLKNCIIDHFLVYSQWRFRVEGQSKSAVQLRQQRTDRGHKNIPCPCHLAHRVGPSASSIMFFPGYNKQMMTKVMDCGKLLSWQCYRHLCLHCWYHNCSLSHKFNWIRCLCCSYMLSVELRHSCAHQWGYVHYTVQG
jgi:hypothetical protein